MTPARAVVHAVASALDVTPELVLTRVKLPTIVLAREVISLVLHENFTPRPSLVEIGIALGGRHHTGVITMLARARLKRHSPTFQVLYEVALAELVKARLPVAEARRVAKQARREELIRELAALDEELGTIGKAAE